jgi:hypothetical protein
MLLLRKYQNVKTNSESALSVARDIITKVIPQTQLYVNSRFGFEIQQRSELLKSLD